MCPVEVVKEMLEVVCVCLQWLLSHVHTNERTWMTYVSRAHELTHMDDLCHISYHCWCVIKQEVIAPGLSQASDMNLLAHVPIHSII